MENNLTYILPDAPKGIFQGSGELGIFEERNNNLRHGRRYEKIIAKNPDGTDHIELPESGGIFVYHETFKYPEKGWRRDEVVMANQFAKRIFISWIQFLATKQLIPAYIALFLMPWKWIIKVMEAWFVQLNLATSLVIAPYFLEEKRYTEVCRELRIGIRTFFTILGVNEKIADLFALMFVTFIEYDTAHRVRVIDILSETTYEKMLKDPRNETRRLMKLLAERENRAHLVVKYDSLARLLTMGLYLPRIRKAFNQAIKSMDFKRLQYDEIDRDYVCRLMDYNFFGLTHEERLKIYPPELHKYIEL